jgi:phosphoribosylformimino-5-aminoimidazole carboxamide ribotide isomerase
MARQFTVYPAIDVLAGRVVRLRPGRREQVTVEGGNPAAAAEWLVREGADWLHLVDLDGAFEGTPDLELVRHVAAAGVPVQVGGGYRRPEHVEEALEAGAARVLVGTAALSPSFLHEVVDRFGEAVAVAVDARDGRVAVEGWTTAGALAPRELAERCAAAGVARLVVTATNRDGTLGGPDLALIELVLAAGVPVIAAGGVSTLSDLRALRVLGCEGAVTGSALWLGRFALSEAASLQA